MRYWNKRVQRQQLFCWLLVFAIVLQLTSVLNFHLHHVDVPEPHGHHHHIDQHSLGDGHKTDVLAHIDSQEFKTTFGGIIQKNLDSNLMLAIAVFLLLILPVIVIENHRLWLITHSPVFRNLYYGLSPPLRAPPAV